MLNQCHVEVPGVALVSPAEVATILRAVHGPFMLRSWRPGDSDGGHCVSVVPGRKASSHIAQDVCYEVHVLNPAGPLPYHELAIAYNSTLFMFDQHLSMGEK